jgi:3-oxoacyl-[acyl-carrier-protein] synthase II
MKRRRVVITGLGVVAPNGIGKDAFWQNLVAGHSAVDYITAFDASSFPCKVAAEVKNFDPRDFIPARKARTMGRFSQFAVAAAKLAIEDAELSEDKLAFSGLCFGTATQGAADLGEVAYRQFLGGEQKFIKASVGLEYTAHAATAHVQEEVDIRGPVMTIASACCTGIDTIAWGASQIQSGEVNVALVGATDTPISEFILSLFVAGGYITEWKGPPSMASRPYDSLHSGFVPSEGSAALILEELEHALDRGALAYAEVLGYASASEGRSGRRIQSYAASLKQAILKALKASNLTPQDVDYICAHGNSLKIEDQTEALAHRITFGPFAYRIPISSIKSMLGQPFSASGLMQAAAATLAVHHGVLPPTINHSVPDPECDLDYIPNQARVARIRHCLFHSHSLGGHLPGSHSAMVVGKLNN